MICLLLGFSSYLYAQNIYSYSIPKIEGGSQSTSAFQNKKILVITLPIQQNASADSLLHDLDTLAAAHINNLKIIAVPAYEDGFSTNLKSQLQQWYRAKLGSYILISDGIYTRKTSGTQQHNLFKWLTELSKNEFFDIDVTGEGFKFYIDESGELKGVLRPQTKVGSRSVQKTLGL